ncbi:hypothetical protein CC2G_006130 [Coprinopsis cinerea AmutBmut pab1-1]|nr:hypothetical protein CC2G_006130 [Coprinopsis cinerea AmutBmut pab1-1]
MHTLERIEDWLLQTPREVSLTQLQPKQPRGSHVLGILFLGRDDVHVEGGYAPGRRRRACRDSSTQALPGYAAEWV